MIGGQSKGQSATAPSVRLVQVLRTYCHQLKPEGLIDLRQSLEAGRYGWLRDELRTAIETEAFGPHGWAGAVGLSTAPGDKTDRRAMRREQRRVWQFLFPGDPVPRRRSAVPSRPPAPEASSRGLPGG